MRPDPRRAAAAVAMVCLGILTGCSSGGDKGPPTTSPSTSITSPTEATPTPSPRAVGGAPRGGAPRAGPPPPGPGGGPPGGGPPGGGPPRGAPGREILPALPSRKGLDGPAGWRPKIAFRAVPEDPAVVRRAGAGDLRHAVVCARARPPVR